PVAFGRASPGGRRGGEKSRAGLEAEGDADEPGVRVDGRALVRGGGVVPEREFRAEVCVPILAEHADVPGEQPGDARAQLDADRCIAVGLVPRREVEAVIRVRHENGRAAPEMRLKLAVRERRAFQERGPEQGVESDHPDREIDVVEYTVDADISAEGSGLPVDVRREVGKANPEAEVERTDVEREPVAPAQAARE